MGKLNELECYQDFHKHTSLSHRYNKDSSLTPNDYFKYMIDNFKDYPKIYSTVEHGWQGNYFKIYDEIEKINKNFNNEIINNKKNKFYSPNCKPIKFVFGTEGYFVKDRFEKDNTNCHIILLAKNDNGRKKINRAIYESYKSGYYYKGRMDLDILLSLPKDDIFVTTACVAFWGYDKQKIEEKEEQVFAEDDQSQRTVIHPNITKKLIYDSEFKETTEIIHKLNNHFTDFYLEAQPHNTDLQRQINKHIIKLHNEYNIPIIAGIDSHIINKSQFEDREDLLRSNKIHYDDEEGWFMDYPSLDVLIERFQNQGVMSNDEIYEAINNTNKTLDFEDIILDRKIKVPVAKQYKHLSLEERNKIFEDILRKEWKEQLYDINKEKHEQYIKEIKHDIGEIEGCGMADYFIDNYLIMKLGQEKGGILTPSGRGSGVSMYLNKLFRFTKVDKINSPVLMYSERFLTKERILDSKTPPDIDHNVSLREPFIEAQKEIICEEGTFDLLALGTLHYKSAFKMYARAYNLDPQLANDVTKQISQYEDALKYAEDDEKDLIDIYDYVDKDKYEDLIEGCQQYKGIVDNVKSHPCGCLCYDGDAVEDVGVIMVKSESTGRECFVAVIESGTIDAFGYLKQDYLIVDSIGLTYKIYKEIGIEPMSVNELLIKIDNDKKTWDVYANGNTMCINQAEQSKSTQKVMKFKPKNISELTQWISGIRPAFKTMYHIFESRKHFDYGIKAFDALIQDEYCDSSFILYQEHLMKVLAFAVFEIGETYTIIKAISKKKDYIIKESKEKFIPNFANAILETNEISDKNEALELSARVWQIIEDSAAYGFNSAHAYCMAIDSVTLAWQKAHYPLEFYKVSLQWYTNKGNKDKVGKLKQEMLKNGIKLDPIKFGDDNREFSIKRETNSIAQTMSSVKDMQKIVPDIMYELGKSKYKDFMYVLGAIKKTAINKKSLEILIELDYFSEFGDPHFLKSQILIYDELNIFYTKYSTCKQYKKSDTILPLDEVAECCGKETPKQFSDIDNEALIKVFRRHYKQLLSDTTKKYPYIPATNMDKIQYEVKRLGYTDITDDVNTNLYCLCGEEKNKWGTSFLTLYNIYSGVQKVYKVKCKYELPKVEVGDILKCAIDSQRKGHYEEVDGEKKWVTDEGYVDLVINYGKIK